MFNLYAAALHGAGTAFGIFPAYLIVFDTRHVNYGKPEVEGFVFKIT